MFARLLAACLLAGCVYEVPEAPGEPVQLTAVADTYIWDGIEADNNFGAASELTVKDGGTEHNRQAFVRFELPAAFEEVRQATLRLDVRVLPNGAPVTLSVSSVSDDAWDEMAVTWNAPPPGVSVDELVSATVTEPAQIELDVTAFVAGELGDRLVSLSLYSDRGENKAICIYSREGGIAHGPVLVTAP